MSDPRAVAFLHFLRGLKGGENCSHLFLLGDIFDLWIGDHAYFSDAYAPIVDEIQRLVSEKVEVHYFEGNHDLYLKSFWDGRLGVRVHSGPEVLQLGPYSVRLEHGDQTDPIDRGYIFLRWFLRTGLMRWLAAHLPGWLVLEIGQRASATSRHYTSAVKTVNADQARAKLRLHAERVAAISQYDLLINGHVHVEDDVTFTIANRQFRALNLGSWLFGSQPYLRLTVTGPERYHVSF